MADMTPGRTIRAATRPVLLATALLAVGASCTSAPSRGSAPHSPRLAAWPDDPCAVLTAAQVAAATGLEVAEARRTPSIAKIVQARDEGRGPGPGAFICTYETRSDVGGITIVVPPPAERTAAAYRAARDTYFRQYRGSGHRIRGLGEDAWIGAGTTLRVLAREDLYFVVATQMYQERSEALLIALARAVLARL